MSGARQLAYDCILPLIAGGERVLDVGAGAAPLAGMIAAKGCRVVAIDRDGKALQSAWETSNRSYEIAACDASKVKSWSGYILDPFDVILAVYSVQHMLGAQAFVWSRTARALKRGGMLIYVGRYRKDAPVIEDDREDPLLADNELTIRTFALACGLELAELRLYKYEGNDYHEAGFAVANAIVARMVKPL
jgi:SAM-dependent methyltransferase